MFASRATILPAAVTAFAVLTSFVTMASGAPPQFLVLDLVTGMSFVVAGAVAARLRPASPAGPLLTISGALWYVGSYAPTGHPVLMHIGFAFERYYDLVLAALLLLVSSPARRLEPRFLIVAMAISFVARSLARLLFSSPILYPECEGCPPNPFALWPDRVTFETVEVVASLAIAGLAVAVGLVTLTRLVRAGPVMRRVRAPILVAGGIAMTGAAFDAFEYAWTTATAAPLLDLPEPWDEISSWAMFGTRVLVALAFLVATLRLRSAPGPLGPLTAGLDPARGPDALEDALRTALGDRSLVLLRPSGGRWATPDGRPPAAHVDGGRAVTFLGGGDAPLAAIDHDEALLEQQELLDAVVRVLGLALENERLEAELREQLRAVTESRQRIVTATEDERRKIERDLHDGAQQRLVAVMLALSQARATADGDAVPEALRGQLDEAAAEAGEAVRELRELARGIHPAILEDEGLGPAVAALARRAGVPVDIRADLDGRLPRLVESTAYFTIAEALMNAQRHARASRASVRLAQSPRGLELEVADDGVGGADPASGSGLRGLADRVVAVGGSLDVDSRAGAGTRVRATIPIPATQ